MLRSLTLRGRGASVVWKYHTAAVVRTWTVVKSEEGAWTLSAGVDRADRFQLQQRPLQFVAPRSGGIGFFCWPIRTVTLGREQLQATLGPPEY
jgi:hypothetical protein